MHVAWEHLEGRDREMKGGCRRKGAGFAGEQVAVGEMLVPGQDSWNGEMDG